MSKSKDCMEEKSQEGQNSRNIESVTEQLESPDLKNVGSNTGEKNERTSVADTVRKCWPARLAKEQISKRLDGKEMLLEVYLFYCSEGTTVLTKYLQEISNFGRLVDRVALYS